MSTPNFALPNPASMADGQTIRWNAATGRFDPADLAGAEVLVAVEASGLPFDLPNSGPFGSPVGFQPELGPIAAGDRILVQAWVQLTNGDSENPHGVEAEILFNEGAVLDTLQITLAADESIMFPLQTVITSEVDIANPVLSVGYRTDGAGIDITLGSLIVSRVSA
jgi:hypothetical protein